jgi:hypothetical protein
MDTEIILAALEDYKKWFDPTNEGELDTYNRIEAAIVQLQERS